MSPQTLQALISETESQQPVVETCIICGALAKVLYHRSALYDL
jgi:hypothetical protein